MANKRINVTELDFDGIKENLKEFLRGQEKFSDYNFDGSGLSILLDVLAYNTHYNLLYQNLAVNESFIDSASKRASVVSRAKALGYIPRSARSSTAYLNVRITTTSTEVNVMELPRYSPFTTTNDGVTYTFYTTQSHIAYRNNNVFVFSNIEVKEGKPLAYNYTVADGVQYIIPNANVDMSTLTVKIQESGTSSDYEIFEPADSLLDLNGESKIYFSKEIDNGLFEVEFGDGIIGKALTNGNIVIFNYMVCSGNTPNGAINFHYTGPKYVPGQTELVSTQVAASNGSAAEDIESIRRNAPKMYTAQNRCVTLNDYRTLIMSLYPTARSVNVWGGENHVPVSYGDVYISIMPAEGEALFESDKQYLLNDILAPRRMVTVHPKLIDPAFINLQLDIAYYYNPSDTRMSVNDLSAAVYNDVIEYGSNNLDKFGGIFKYSAVSRTIDNVDASITNSVISIKMHRDVTITFNQVAQYNINLANPIFISDTPKESIISTGFYVLNAVDQLCYIDDEPEVGSSIGKLRLFYRTVDQKVILRYVGTVNYTTGVISIENLIITESPSSYFTLVIKPGATDIVSARNQIVSISPSLMKVTPVVNRDADNYSFVRVA